MQDNRPAWTGLARPMDLQTIIESRHPVYLHQTITTLLLLHQIKRLNDRQWHSLHYMQFCELLATDQSIDAI